MNYELLFAARGEVTVRTGLIGVGQFGASLIAQARKVDGLSVPVICDRDVDRARQACNAAGLTARICSSPGEAEDAIAVGDTAVLAEADMLMRLPLDVIVEATGNPEAAAVNAMAAIAAGKHLVIASKEAESVIGPLIARRAHDAGLVATSVEGDQPSLLIGLVSWARVLGLEIVCAGKSSEYDFVFDPETETVTWQTQHVSATGLLAHWHLPQGAATNTLARRAEILYAIPHRTVPDLCEMGVVANATGLMPDTPGFHVPIARTVEVPEVLCPATDGGVLAKSGVIDVFNCLRRPDEQSFAGGVFIVVRCDNAETWDVLRGKGIPVSRGNGYAMLYNPSHLLGVEAPVSILSAALLGHPTGGASPQPVVDVVARANRDWKAGETLAITDHHHHEVAGLDPLLVPSAPAVPGNPAPYYMAAGGTLAKDVPAGEMITIDALVAPADSTLWQLRAEQDTLFGR